MTELITTDLVSVDADLGGSPADVIAALAGRIAAAGRATDAEAVVAAALEREAKSPTGMPGGIAIPHCRSSAVTEPTLAMARLRPAVDFGAKDGPADLAFLIAVPDGAGEEHLRLLATLARSLVRPDFVADLRSAADADALVRRIGAALDGSDAAAPAPAQAADDGASRPLLVAVTACPTGIAHTYLAADALRLAADAAGAELHVETQGSSGATPLDPALIERADAAIFAVDVDVRDRGRFAGLPLVQGPVKRGVDAPRDMVDEAIRAIGDPGARRVAGSRDAAAAPAAREGAGRALQRWLLTGVSYMIPFVAAGGILIAISFLIAGADIGNENVARDVALENSLWSLPPEGLVYYLGAVANVLGGSAMGFFVAALAGFIAYAMADRPGIAPGFAAGAVSVTMGAGFLGGIAGGLLAGGAAMLIGRLRVPSWLRGLMPVVIIPLLATIVGGGLLLLVLGGPIAALTTALTDALNSLTGTGAILLGVILGLMMCIDLGGPVNKVAYAFAVAGLATGSAENPAPWQIMAAVMAAGMVPPLAMALASTVLARRLFTPVERQNGASAWLLGATFISEGAIPFAAADPLRVIPASLLGGAVTGGLSMAWGVTSQAPHGGLAVALVIGGLPWFLLAIAAGTIVSALAVIALKRWARRRTPAGVGAPEPAVAGGTV